CSHRMTRAAGMAGVVGASARPGRPPGGATPSRAYSRGKRLARDSRAATESPNWAPDLFSLRVRLEETGEMFRVANCRIDMTVRELKEELDLMAGIPINLQLLKFLDQGILMDDATLKFYDVIPGAIISLAIWHYDGWTELVLAAVEGDPSKLSCLGISEDSFYRTANSQNFKDEQWQKWTAQRAFVALYICAHRGHKEAVKYLLELGADCLGKSPLGRTPLHVAAAMGRVDCIAPLLEYGASIHDSDTNGDTPISIARHLKRPHCAHKMFLLYWMTKSGTKDPTNLMLREALYKTSSSFNKTSN
uniref:Ankyrin repeat domain 60 n=1 Tax=Nannospalax galili TaxID=1026970 RepID=A0A8C6R4X9_NANGA